MSAVPRAFLDELCVGREGLNMEQIESLKAVQEEFSQELRRTTGCGCTFVYCGGGWYAIQVDGDSSPPRHRWQRRTIERALMMLQARPDLNSEVVLFCSNVRIPAEHRT